MALPDWIKKNTSGTLNKVFLAGYIAEIATADNKWKASLKTIKEFAIWNTRLFLPAAFVSAWVGMGRTVKAILHDTGSLDAALRRMSAIQGFQRTFAPLVGGLTAAKQRVAELIQLSAKGPFRFEEVAAGAHSLEVLTRGAFSGSQAMTKIGNAAAASGNSIEATAAAVGKFSNELRSGGSISAASEELRQMGLITQSTADDLVALGQHGANSTTIFEKMTASLAGTSDSMKDLADDVDAIHDASKRAGEGLQQAFGTPFAEKDLQNTKNYTAAMLAVTPAVGRVAEFLAILTNGFSTVKSTLIAAVAQSEAAVSVFEFLAKAIATVIAVGAALSTIGLGLAITGWATALTGLGGALGIAGVAVAALGTTLIALPFVVGAGVLINYTATINKATDAMLAMGKANRETEAALNKQIASMKTLADYHEATAKAIALEEAAQNDLNAAQEKANKIVEQRMIGFRASGALTGKELEDQRAKLQEQADFEVGIAEKKRNLVKLQKTANTVLTKGPGANLTSDQEKEGYRVAAQRSIALETEEFEKRRARPGAGTAAVLQDRAELLRGREQLARVGSQVTANLPRRQEEVQAQVALAEEKLKRAQSSGDDGRIKAAQAGLAGANKEAASVGLNAAAGTSVQLLAQAQQVRAGGNAKQAAKLEIQAEIAKQREENPENASSALFLEAENTRRAENVAREQERLGLAAKVTRRSGNSAGAEQLEDTERFGKHFEELKGLPEAERLKRATALSQEDIFQTTNFQGSPAVASSLARIGGGGGVYAPGGDPMVRLGERQANLLTEIKNYLETIAKGTGGGVE